MGLSFLKKRVGTFKPSDGSGRHFVWTIPEFTKFEPGSTLDSENVACFSKVKFHFHMQLSQEGDIGLYIHYKKPPIPKYSYYFENQKGEIMRQHTAHTIPDDTERCGHWNVCTSKEMTEFVGEEGTLLVRVSFDEDVIKVIPGQNVMTIMWTIPNVMKQNLNPYSSKGYSVDYSGIVTRLDVKRNDSNLMAKWNPNDINTFIVFLFCRKGKIPPHSIELLNSKGEPYYVAPKKEDGSTTTLMVDRKLVVDNLGREGTLFVKIDLFTGGNPLEALGALGQLGAPAEGGDGAGAGSGETKKVEIGEKKEMYDVMDD